MRRTDHSDRVPPTQLPPLHIYTSSMISIASFTGQLCPVLFSLTPLFFFFIFSLVFLFSCFSIDKLSPRRRASLVCGVRGSQPSQSWDCFGLSDCTFSPPPHYLTLGPSYLISLSFPCCLYLLFTFPSLYSADSLFPSHLYLTLLLCTVLALFLSFFKC